MHRLRCAVRENRLSDPSRVTEASYLPYIGAGTTWIAESDQHILGFAALDLRSSSVWALFVTPDAEGSGIGRALHRHMLERARQLGVERLWLDTSAGTRAELFYKAAGWEQEDASAGGELRLCIDL